MTEVKRQRIVVVRECIWELTGQDFYAAAVLGQMLYWSLRTKDIDGYLEEENQRMAQTGDKANVALTRGWVYKSAEELSEELMEICSRRTVGRRLDKLVEAGWLEKRNNPNHQWDRTLQYRPNLKAIDQGLQEIGYSLEDALPQGDWTVVREYVSIGHRDQCIGQGDQSIGHSDQSIGQGDQSIGHSVQAIPETTAKTTAESRETETAAGRSQAWCSIHQKPMKLRSKGGEQWYSHQLSNGTWCKGAPGDQPYDVESKNRRLDSEGQYKNYIQT